MPRVVLEGSQDLDGIERNQGDVWPLGFEIIGAKHGGFSVAGKAITGVEFRKIFRNSFWLAAVDRDLHVGWNSHIHIENGFAVRGAHRMHVSSAFGEPA